VNDLKNLEESVQDIIITFIQKQKNKFSVDREYSVIRETWSGASKDLDQVSEKLLGEKSSEYHVYLYPNTLVVIPRESSKSLVYNRLTKQYKTVRM